MPVSVSVILLECSVECARLARYEGRLDGKGIAAGPEGRYEGGFLLRSAGEFGQVDDGNGHRCFF